MNRAQHIAEGSGRAPGRAPLVAVVLIAAAGFGVSIELTRIHYLTHTDPSYHSVCAVNQKVNCETVAQSPYSIFAGLPISVWGMLAYALLAALAAWGALPRLRPHPAWPRGGLLLLFAFAFAVSGLLGWVSVFRIDSVCVFCTTLYVLNTALLAVGIVGLVRARLGPFAAIAADIGAVARSPRAPAVFAAVFAAALAGLVFGLTPYWQHPAWNDLPDLPSGVAPSGGRWIGAEDPLVTVVEFSDYECPFCRRAHRNLRALAAEHPHEIRLVHRHIPLDETCNDGISNGIHGRACELSEAAECAADQGRFWAMNDALFSVQEFVRTRDVDVARLAAEIGLDVEAFGRCMESHATLPRIRRDIAAADRRRVVGTPTFFVGSQPFPGGVPQFVIDNALEDRRAARKGDGAKETGGKR